MKSQPKIQSQIMFSFQNKKFKLSLYWNKMADQCLGLLHPVIDVTWKICIWKFAGRSPAPSWISLTQQFYMKNWIISNKNKCIQPFKIRAKLSFTQLNNAPNAFILNATFGTENNQDWISIETHYFWRWFLHEMVNIERRNTRNIHPRKLPNQYRSLTAMEELRHKYLL